MALSKLSRGSMTNDGEPIIKMLPPSFSSPLPPVQTLLPPIDRGDENGDEERVAFNEDEEEFDDSPVVVRERRVFPFSSIDASIFRSALPLTSQPLFSISFKNKHSSARRPLPRAQRPGTTSSPTRSPPRPRGLSGRSSRGLTPPLPLPPPRTTTVPLLPVPQPALPPLPLPLLPRAPPQTLPCFSTPAAPASARAAETRWDSGSSTRGLWRCCRFRPPRTLPPPSEETRRPRLQLPLLPLPPRSRETRSRPLLAAPRQGPRAAWVTGSSPRCSGGRPRRRRTGKEGRPTTAAAAETATTAETAPRTLLLAVGLRRRRRPSSSPARRQRTSPPASKKLRSRSGPARCPSSAPGPCPRAAASRRRRSWRRCTARRRCPRSPRAATRPPRPPPRRGRRSRPWFGTTLRGLSRALPLSGRCIRGWQRSGRSGEAGAGAEAGAEPTGALATTAAAAATRATGEGESRNSTPLFPPIRSSRSCPAPPLRPSRRRS